MSARSDVYDALLGLDADVNVYRGPQKDFHYPAVVVELPDTINVRPVLASDGVDAVVDVVVAVEVTDDDSAADLLLDLVDSVGAALLAGGTWDVRAATKGDGLTRDGRSIIFYRFPVTFFVA